MLTRVDYCKCGVPLYVYRADGSADGTEHIAVFHRINAPDNGPYLKCGKCRRIILRDGIWGEFDTRVEEARSPYDDLDDNDYEDGAMKLRTTPELIEELREWAHDYSSVTGEMEQPGKDLLQAADLLAYLHKLHAAAKEMLPRDRYYLAQCLACGHVASSEHFVGVQNIDDYSIYCPVESCGSDNVEDADVPGVLKALATLIDQED